MGSVVDNAKNENRFLLLVLKEQYGEKKIRFKTLKNELKSWAEGQETTVLADVYCSVC